MLPFLLCVLLLIYAFIHLSRDSAFFSREYFPVFSTRLSFLCVEMLLRISGFLFCLVCYVTLVLCLPSFLLLFHGILPLFFLRVYLSDVFNCFCVSLSSFFTQCFTLVLCFPSFLLPVIMFFHGILLLLFLYVYLSNVLKCLGVFVFCFFFVSLSSFFTLVLCLLSFLLPFIIFSMEYFLFSTCLSFLCVQMCFYVSLSSFFTQCVMLFLFYACLHFCCLSTCFTLEYFRCFFCVSISKCSNVFVYLCLLFTLCVTIVLCLPSFLLSFIMFFHGIIPLLFLRVYFSDVL